MSFVDGSDIHLKRFNPETMLTKHATMLFAGAKKTGKSFTARCIAYYLRNRVFDSTVFSGSEELDHPWSQYIPDSFVHSDYDESVMSAIMKRQEERRKIANHYGTTPPSHLVIFEDLEYKHHNVFYEESSKQLLLNGRHSCTYPMVLIQYIMKGLTREIRGMFEFVFLQKEPDIAVRRKMWTVFGGCCAKFDQFDSIFRMCTDNYGTLVIALRENSYNIEDNFFWFKAKDMGPFCIGHPDVWRFHRENYKGDSRFAIDKSTSVTALIASPGTAFDTKTKTKKETNNANDNNKNKNNKETQYVPEEIEKRIIKKGYVNGGHGSWIKLVTDEDI